MLQGGGALGAYQGGAYEALADAGQTPNWLAGISIDAIVSAKSDTLGFTTLNASDTITVDVETDNATDGVAIAAGTLQIEDAAA